MSAFLSIGTSSDTELFNSFPLYNSLNLADNSNSFKAGSLNPSVDTLIAAKHICVSSSWDIYKLIKSLRIFFPQQNRCRKGLF